MPADSKTVAAALFQALEDERWAEAASLMHPEALADLRDRYFATFQMAQDLRRRFLSQPRSLPPLPGIQNPELLAAATRGFHDLMSEEVVPADEGFARVSTIEEFQRLSAADVMARRLEFSWRRPSQGDLGGAAQHQRARITREILGTLQADGATAYVVYKDPSAPRQPGLLEPADVLMLRMAGGEWRVVPNNDVLYGPKGRDVLTGTPGSSRP